ncbi:MAG TPA: efflux RND transporter periplasmic adaptor subunit [Blastocatellia bacterium]|nr:efflux RND transporter periplasmic adaptor subunit [Blastocatellia bacterium]
MEKATKKALLEGDGKGGERDTADAIVEPSSQGQGETEGRIAEPGPETPKPAARGNKRRMGVRLVLVILAISILGVGVFKRRSIVDAVRSRLGGSSPDQKTAGAGSRLKVLYWVDAMNPTQRYDKPGKAPDGMDLVPVYDESGGTAKNLPEGAFKISPEKQQLIGVTYGEAKLESVSKTLRAVGRLTYDETKIGHVHTKIEGWIDKVFVDFTGKLVKSGEPLLTIYSPDLVQTQEEYLLALKGKNELEESDFPEAAASALSLLQSTKQRLELWDISDQQIKEIESRGTPNKDLTLYSPSNGFVVARNAYSKQRVTPDSELYTIADLSTIWVIADVYEYEAQGIQVGDTATVTLSYLPSRRFTGKISYISPQVDSTTRTVKVRIEVPNPDYALKPDMYANVDLKKDYGRHVVVPQEAVLDSGSTQMVFVALGDGYFEPRTVKLGESANGMAIVLQGLKPGEKVVTSANFLVDSESKLKSATGGMGMPGMPGMSGGGEGAKGPSQNDHKQHQPAGQPSSQPSPGGATKAMPDGSTMAMPEAPSKQPVQPAAHSQHQAAPKNVQEGKPGGRTMVMPDGSTMVMPGESSKQSVQPADHSQRQATPKDHDTHKPDAYKDRGEASSLEGSSKQTERGR